jgi:3-oxoadipate enol-lactonase
MGTTLDNSTCRSPLGNATLRLVSTDAQTLCAMIVAALLLLAGCASSPGKRAGSPSAAHSHFMKFGTNRIHYVVEGKGRHNIVLVHCWAGTLEFWRSQVPAFADKARLILIDLPGHGRSDKPETAYTMDFFAQAVLAVMHDAHVQKATLIGHSMGVPIICRVYRQAPDRVAALVAVDGQLRRPQMTAEQSARFLSQFCGPDYCENTRNFLKTMFPVPRTEALRDRIISEMLQTPQHVMRSAMEGMFAPDQPDWDLHHVSVPVLIINAPYRHWPDDYPAYVRSLSVQTDLRVIEGTGHFLMLEKPAVFNAALIDMLGKNDLIETKP